MVDEPGMEVAEAMKEKEVHNLSDINTDTLLASSFDNYDSSSEDDDMLEAPPIPILGKL